ncbi:hypothetical protein IT415_02200 [bacterium]|nr:hypothetical protein [bacterium]
MKKFIYRLFVTVFLVGFELVIYFVLWFAWLRPAQDIYFMGCMPDGTAGNSVTCNPYVPAKIGLTAIEVIVATTISLGIILAISALVQANKARRSRKVHDKAADSVDATEESE